MDNKDFRDLIVGFVFNCPSSIRKPPKRGDKQRKTPKCKTEYKGVSARQCSFRNNGVEGGYLTTILAHIRRPLALYGTYAVLSSEESVEDKINEITRNSTLSSSDFEIVVYQERTDMSNTEAIYYYIRNAFAHGSFEVKKIYIL